MITPVEIVWSGFSLFFHTQITRETLVQQNNSFKLFFTLSMPSVDCKDHQPLVSLRILLWFSSQQGADSPCLSWILEGRVGCQRSSAFSLFPETQFWMLFLVLQHIQQRQNQKILPKAITIPNHILRLQYKKTNNNNWPEPSHPIRADTECFKWDEAPENNLKLCENDRSLSRGNKQSP